jgi:redox-sensitive bicupin YhaK (pirin superfamily)
MSWASAEDATCREAPECRLLELVLEPRPRDIGAFEVRRALPTRQRRAVGPFVFFDEMGPAVLPAGQGMDVRPHPHINLATVTYLFEGAIMHRDSLGTELAIEPGAVNLMIAGRGITHSERSPDGERGAAARLHGLQLWIALPEAHEEDPPSFHHHPEDDLPGWQENGAHTRLLMGAIGERRSPVPTRSETLYAVYRLEAGAEVTMPPAQERGLYVVSGQVEVAGAAYDAGRMLILGEGRDVRVRSASGARLALVGGAPLGPRHMFWNFVSSRKDRIEAAKADWKAERFPVVPGDAAERIPLPE